MKRIEVFLRSFVACSILFGGLLLPSWQDGWAAKQAKAAALQQAFLHGRTYAYVTQVNVGEDNHLWINVKGNLSKEHGCPGPWFARSKYQLNDPRTQAQMQIALASFGTRRQVYIETFGCHGDYPVMVKLQVQQD